MRLIKKCDLCGGKKLNFLISLEDENRTFSGIFNLYECEKCGLKFLNPQPSFKELKPYYPKDDYYRRIGQGSSNKLTSIKDSFARWLFLISVRYPRVFKIFLSPFGSFVRGVEIIPYGKYLDLGCGGGQFLFELKNLNPTGDYYGIEPGDFNESDPKKYKINIFKGFLHEAGYPDNYFDLITANHVFEHLSNPSQTLREIKKILKPHATLIISVPNYNSLARVVFGQHWYLFDAPRHLFHFSDKIMKLYAQKFNFKIKRIRYTSLPDSFVISLVNLVCKTLNKKYIYILFKEKARKGNIFLSLLLLFLYILFFPLAFVANLLKKGDSIEIWLENIK